MSKVEWVSVDENLPEPGQYVLRYGQCSFIGRVHHMDVGQLVANDGRRWADFGVTHWMPLPDPPVMSEVDGDRAA